VKPADLLFVEPRGYAGTAIMIAAVSGVPFAVLISLWFAATRQRPLVELLPSGVAAGLVFGVCFGLIMAFLFRGETTAVEVADADAFVPRLNIALSQLGYHPATHDGDFLTFKPSWQAGLAAGRIAVQLQDERAVIVGPRMYVRKLVERLETV
jgi:hypothetical protein